ncbi:MAG: DUF4268 domain-containing protein [Acidobacteria bacterium]|nr:DUF4268 domain-containing protein [Acidobacteriota bacterium]
MKEFGVLQKLDLREIWKKEATEFTPWLAKNLGALGRVIGMDLELVTQEAPVGDFSLDVLARDLGHDRIVIIENQLAATDHDHLGKLLTYAAGNSAGVVIWVAAEIRDEHRQALDWLNQHTDSDIEFYAVVVEVVRIDNSNPAYDFRPVVFPNQWRKTRIVSAGSRQTTKKGEAYRDFFQQLIDELREKHKFTGARVAFPQNWYSFASGVGGVTYSFSFAQGGRVRTELYIGGSDITKNKKLFDSLLQERETLEARLGGSLEWERLDDKIASRIAVYRSGSIDESSQLAEIRSWAIARLLQFKNSIGPRLAILAD